MDRKFQEEEEEFDKKTLQTVTVLDTPLAGLDLICGSTHDGTHIEWSFQEASEHVHAVIWHPDKLQQSVDRAMRKDGF